MATALAPAFFDDSTLEEAFQRLFQPFVENSDCHFVVKVDESVKAFAIPLDLQLNLYRILQEQFRNVLKYAHATTMEVSVSIVNNKLSMKVTDNGIGFDQEKVSRGIGMANMKRRTELFSGRFYMNSSPGNGCEMLIKIPLQQVRLSA